MYRTSSECLHLHLGFLHQQIPLVMKSLCACGILVLQASSVFGCVKDYNSPSFFDPHAGLQKRQETQFPPVLTEQEAILVNSIDNVTLEEWNYYYAHSYHLAGTNRTIAQWTADRWSESGFDSRLVEYRTISIPLLA